MNWIHRSVIIVETTLGTTGEAKALARDLVEKRLAACCHLIPVSSCYRWQEKVEEAAEVLLRCKTVRKRAKEVVEYIRQHHSYAVPEIVVTRGEVCCKEYFEWLQRCI
jgi:periplasmic divalent cation tolerance protein